MNINYDFYNKIVIQENEFKKSKIKTKQEMTTTDKFQKYPDYYTNLEECKKASKESYRYLPTNPRYKEFNQIHFTAGDEDQFDEFRHKKTNKKTEYKQIDTNNIFLKDVSLWYKYKNLNALAVDNTFNYIFNKFKKGIFVKIQNNELKVFLPFSKRNFTNEWGHLVAVDPKIGNIEEFSRQINVMNGKGHFKQSVNKFSNNWYANNALVRFEYPINEGDTNVTNMRDMLLTLCKERDLPDIEFFLNRRDFPIITNNETEAYDEIFGDNVKLLSHKYEKYSPILSMVTTSKNADIAIPTGDDWSRISSHEGKFFIDDCKEYPKPEDFKIQWKDKKPTGVFRGASTGVGVTIETNPRIKVAYLSSQNKKDLSGKFKDIPYLDAGISKWQVRARKLKNSRYLQTIDIKEMEKKGIKISSFLDYFQQSEYKYLIHIDGHVSAFRLSVELSMGCCLLMVDSKYSLWFKHLLVPYEHYIPIKEDLSDLFEKIKWCRDNDIKCETIAKNSLLFYNTYLKKDGIMDYLQTLLVSLKKEIGVYNYHDKTPLENIIETEEKQLSESLLLNGVENFELPIKILPRCYGLFKLNEKILKSINKNSIAFEQLFLSKTSKVEKGNLGSFSFVIKSSTDILKINQQIHEAYLGTKEINKLSLELPHFQYTYGLSKEKSVLLEYIHGKPFLEWIKSDFTITNYLLILIQLSFALEIAQRRTGFVHNDLAPWNIIIQTYDEPKEIEYLISVNNVVSIKTNIVPVIIDYGKSHIVTDLEDSSLEHVGYINMFKISTIEDIITILLTSVLEIPFSTSLEKDLITLSNFLSNTGYRRKPFFKMSDIKFFFTTNKRYAERIISNKYELEEKSPLDFIKYILSNFSYTFPIKNKKHLSSFDQNVGTSNCMMSLLNNTSSKEFEDFLKKPLPDTTDLIFGVYMKEKFKKHLDFYYKMGKDNEKLYKLCLEKIDKHYDIKTMTINSNHIKNLLYVSEIVKFKHEVYTENTFLLPNEIQKLKNEYSLKQFLESDIIESDIIESVHYKRMSEKIFSANNTYSSFLTKELLEFLKVDELPVITMYAHINTLHRTSERLAII
jgi:hypothetical protein